LSLHKNAQPIKSSVLILIVYHRQAYDNSDLNSSETHYFLGYSPVQLANTAATNSLNDFGVTKEMVMLNLDSYYASQVLPLLFFGGLYYLVLTAVHLVTGDAIYQSYLAVLTGFIAICCFGGNLLLKKNLVRDRYSHLLAVILLLGLVFETYLQISIGASSQPIVDIVIATIFVGIVLVSRRGFVLVSLVLLSAFILMLRTNIAFSIYYKDPYAWLSIGATFAVSLIAFVQRRHSILRTIRLRLIDQQRNIELVRANAAKNEFLSSMSHELRTPLNAIMGFAQLMEVDTPTPQENKAWAGYIMDASKHLLHLVSQVLNLSKIESEQVDINREPVIVQKLVDDAISMTVESTADMTVKICKKPAPDLHALTCYTDPKVMHQVLLNLLSNAIKYNNADGTVTISISETPDQKVTISVADTGLGIPEEYQASMFQPFNRLGKETSSIPGTGIGLSISHKLCDAMDVELSFESEVNVGSTFLLTIPAPPPEENNAKSAGR
tara:strand:+ start:120397 stop:121884 length:1488 start_codon:yes stop_codon:yes gene_type:complete